MANRPSKCRICGHRFASGEDICPECFTAREDDISCETMERSEHSHGNDYSTVRPNDVFEEFKTESFIDEQREDEAKDPIPSATYGGKFGQAPQTYAGSTYNDANNALGSGFTGAGNSMSQRQSGSGGSRAEKLAALRSGTYVPQGGQYRGQNYYRAPGQGQPPYTAGYGQRRSPSSKPFVVVIVIIFVLAFFVPLITMIANISKISENANNSSSKDEVRIADVSIDMPDVSIPDINIPDPGEVTWCSEEYNLTAYDMRKGKEFTYAQAKEWFSESDLPFFIGLNEEPSDDTMLRLIEVRLGFDYPDEQYSGRYYFLNYEVVMDAYSVTGEKLTSGGNVNSLYEQGEPLLAFIVPADAFSFQLDVKVYNDYSDKIENAEFDFYGSVITPLDDMYDRRGLLSGSSDNTDASEND